MNNAEMLGIVKKQLSVDLNCAVDDLNGEKDTFIFCEAKDNPGRRPFPRGENHFEMLSMGKSIVVSAAPMLLKYVKLQLEGASRDDAFSKPFIYGHSVYFLPDMKRAKSLGTPDGLQYEMVEKGDLLKLYETKGFSNAIQYDPDHPRPDVLAVLAKKEGKTVSMAGASADCLSMWQIGIDTLPEYRGLGLGAYLVYQLSEKIIEQGIVPYYGTASSNIASQKVAYRAGFMPVWMCVYNTCFEPLVMCSTR